MMKKSIDKQKPEIYIGYAITKEVLDSIMVNDKISCNDWGYYLKVRAVSENYFIMVENYFGKPLYSICEKKPSDFSRNYFSEGSFRIGTDHWIFGKYDYLTPDGCEQALKELESGECELSVLRAVDLHKLLILRTA